MKKLLSICIFLCMYISVSANNSDTTFIRNFYENYIFGNEPFDSSGKKMCSQKLLNYLSAKYEYDCPEKTCYALWCFRSGNQDGPSDVSKVTEISSLGKGWYKIDFIDMGINGSKQIKLIMVDNKREIDELKEKPE